MGFWPKKDNGFQPIAKIKGLYSLTAFWPKKNFSHSFRPKNILSQFVDQNKNSHSDDQQKKKTQCEKGIGKRDRKRKGKKQKIERCDKK